MVLYTHDLAGVPFVITCTVSSTPLRAFQGELTTLVKGIRQTAQWRVQGRSPPSGSPLCLDQTEARRAKNIF